MPHYLEDRRVVVCASAALAWLAFYAAWLAFTPGGERARVVFADTAYLVPIALATALAVYASRRVPSGLKLFWGLLATANGAWLAGEVLWAIQELSAGSVPFPWWTDVAYIGFYLLMPPALLAAFHPSFRMLTPARVLDGALVVGALTLLWWWVVLRPLDLGTDLASLVALAYPTLDLALIGMLVSLWFLPTRQGTLAMKLVAAAVVCGALADSAYTYAAVTDSYLSGAWTELGWQAQAVLFSLAALFAARGIGRSAGWARFRAPAERHAAVVVTATFAVVLAVLLGEAFRGQVSTEVLASAAGIGVALAARVWLLVRARKSGSLAARTNGLYDRAYFEAQLSRLLARGRHFGDPFAVTLLELDHLAGSDPGAEEAEIGRRLGRSSRDVDVLAVLGAGRFGVLHPNVEEDEANELAEGLRLAVASEELRTGSRPKARTVSVGVAVWGKEETPAELMERAGAGVSAAQHLGGNQVRAAADDLLLFDASFDGLGPVLELAETIDAREGRDPGHSRAVADLAAEIAEKLGLDAGAVARAYVAGLLHDLGKLGLADAILQKQGPLDEREWAEIVRHPSAGAELAARIAPARDAAPIIAAHHERWDGAGYPRRLAGEQIPAEARIVAVADALVAMTAERPHRAARSETSALTTIWRESGRRYDPSVVSALLALARAGRLDRGGKGPLTLVEAS